MAGAVTVDDQSFKNEVIDSPVPVLVDFWAEWCGPCKQVAPVVEDIAREYNGKLKVVKVDVDSSQDVSAQYRIFSIPTLMLFKGGQEVERVVGAVPKHMLVSKLQKHIQG